MVQMVLGMESIIDLRELSWVQTIESGPRKVTSLLQLLVFKSALHVISRSINENMIYFSDFFDNLSLIIFESIFLLFLTF